MDKFEQLKIEQHYSLLLLIQEQEEKVKTVYKLMTECDFNERQYLEILISELYSNKSSINAVSIAIGFYHYELTSYLSFFDSMYLQMKEVYADKHRKNTSWLVPEYQNFMGQSDILVRMLKQYTNTK